MKTFLEKRLWEFGKGAALNIVTAAATVGFSVYLGITSGGAIKGNFLAIVGTYTMIAAVFLIGHTIRTASQVYTEDQVEIEQLRERVILSNLQTEILKIARDMRSFMAEHQDYPVEPKNPTTTECEEWSNKLSAWITKFRAEHQERFANRLQEVALGLKKLGIGDAYRLESFASPGPNFPDGCLDPIGVLFDCLIAIECQASDGLAEVIREQALTPLQVEAFWLAKDMRDFLDSMGERPITKVPDYSGEQTAEQLAQYAHDRLLGPEGQWLARFRDKYASEFADRVENLMQRLKKENVTTPHLEWGSIVHDDSQFLKLVMAIETEAIWLSYKLDSGVSENGVAYENRISRRR